MNVKPIIKQVGRKTKLLDTINDNLPQNISHFYK